MNHLMILTSHVDMLINKTDSSEGQAVDNNSWKVELDRVWEETVDEPFENRVY